MSSESEAELSLVQMVAELHEMIEKSNETVASNTIAVEVSKLLENKDFMSLLDFAAQKETYDQIIKPELTVMMQKVRDGQRTTESYVNRLITLSVIMETVQRTDSHIEEIDENIFIVQKNGDLILWETLLKQDL